MTEEIKQSDAARLDGADWMSAAITVLLSLAVYLFTLAPDVTLENSGMLSTAGAYGGVAHPPGYPLWTIYSWLFARVLPWSNIAWRIGVGSAVAAALACGFAAVTVTLGGKVFMQDSTGFEHLTSRQKKSLRLVCGYVAGMTIALSSVVWKKAVIEDVWVLSLLLFTAMQFFALRWIIQPERKRFLGLAFLSLGLLLTSNQELIALLPGLVGVTMLGDRKLGRDLALTILPLGAILTHWSDFGLWTFFPDLLNRPIAIAFAILFALGLLFAIGTWRFATTWKFALLCHGCFILGLSLYFYLPLPSMTNPPMNWGYPRTVECFFHVLSRGQYDRVAPTLNFGAYAKPLWLFIKTGGHEIGWLYVFLAALPFLQIRKVNHFARKWLYALVIMFVCTGLVLVAELGPSPDRQMLELAKTYFMPSLAIVSILAGLGLMLTIRRKNQPSPSNDALRNFTALK